MSDAAMTAFRELLGADHVLTGDAALQRYRWDTTPDHPSIPAALRPATVEQVQDIVRIANAHRVHLYPISTGNNWGYGSAQPVTDGAIILDLGRINRILEIDTELAYAVVEPGVTQRQLYQHLEKQKIPLRLSPTGAGPDCSILGNALERGFGIGPNGDHFLTQCGMEIVLPSGELLRTGFGHYEGAHATYVYKWGVGPYLDGLFTQSNYGIVTKMGVWLTPEPERFEACYFMCNTDEQLGPVIHALRRLLSTGVFQGPINLLHRNRVLIMLDRYPWTEMNGRTPLDESVAARLAAEKRVGIWNGVGALCGSREQVRAARQTIRRLLKGKVDRLTFLSKRQLRALRMAPGLWSLVLRMNVRELLQTLEASFGMMNGIPSEVALKLAYWRHKEPPPTGASLNPARDRCGLMWFAPIIPMTSEHVARFRQVIEPIFAAHRFETCITFTAVNERCFDCTLPLLYDQTNPEEAKRARACYAELVEACKRHGYVAYRLGLQSMEKETGRDDVFWDVVTQLKNALDPGGILAPGRYAR
jgi:4-cresol dehydrogenase (hydroxylating)